MLPNDKLSVPTEYAPFIPPDDKLTTSILSYELGGVGISDASQGLEVQVWTAKLYNASLPSSYITLSAPNTPEYTFLVFPNLSNISLAFDQNMKVALAYTDDIGSYLYWYDTTIPNYTTIQMPANSHSLQVTLDDKRPIPINSGLSDIILSYVRGVNLYFRQQRDRFLIEYLLATSLTMVNPELNKVGMNEVDRVMFKVNGNS